MNYDLLLPLAALPFPKIDPVIVQIGPLAIHWYGAGLYRRHPVRLVVRQAADRQPAAVAGGASAAEARGHRRLPGLGGDRRRARRAHRLRAVLRSAALHRQSARHPRGLAGRHVVPWRLSRHHARHDPVRPARAAFRSGRCSTSSSAGVPVALGLVRIANFINSELWGQLTSVPWAFEFPNGGPFPRHPSQLYEAALEGLVLFLVLRLLTHRYLKLARRASSAAPSSPAMGWRASSSNSSASRTSRSAISSAAG